MSKKKFFLFPLIELIESIRKIDDGNKNLLSEEIESKQWYIQHPIDEEHSDTQSLPLETHSLHSPSRTNNGIICNRRRKKQNMRAWL